MVIKVMIVDDELIARRRLRETIDWNAVGCEVVAEAADGIKALREYEKYKPDIVITDIMMKDADGLDFITTIREKDKYTEIIILTGYEKFDFAKRALESGVGAYILKPIQNETIIKYVEAAVSRIQKKQLDRQITDQNDENVKWQKIMELFDEPEVDREYILKVCKENNIGIQRGNYSIAVIDHDRLSQNSDAYRILIETIKYSARINKVQFFIRENDRIILLALCSEESDYERFENMLFVLKQQYKLQTNRVIRTAISDMFREVTMIMRAYHSVLSKLEYDQKGYSQIVENALNYIKENYSTAGVETMAAELFVSKRTLMRKFKQETGKTIGEYIAEVRIWAAVEMVRTGEYKMINIAHRVGYGDMKHFYEIFKKVTGHSPKYFKEQRE